VAKRGGSLNILREREEEKEEGGELRKWGDLYWSKKKERRPW